MSRKLVIALDSGTADAQNAITNHLATKGWKFWHWVGDLWLVADVPDDLSPRVLWEELKSMPSVKPFSGLAMDVGPGLKYWGNNKPESWVWMAATWGRPDSPGPQARPENEGEMADSSDARRLRADDARAADAAAAVDPPEPAGPVTYLCRTLAVGTYPTTAAAYYAVVALAVSGAETEGSAGVISDASGTFRALNVGTTVPPVGSKVLVTFVNFRWVFRWSG